MARWIGFDAHKSYAQVVELHEGKRTQYRVSLPDGLEGFKQRLDEDDQIVLEASTNSFRLADELRPHVARVVVAHPSQTRGAVSHAAMTDRQAAEALARLLASDFVREVWQPPATIRHLRGLVELRVRLSAQRVGFVYRIQALQRQELVAPERHSLVEEEVRSQIARDSHLQFYCRSLFRMTRHLEAEIQRLDRIFHAWSRKHDSARLLMSIPGIGPVVAAAVVAQVGDIKRFDSPGKLCSYAGLVPRVHHSGLTRTSGSISRKGRSTLRWAMGVAAMAAVRASGPFKEFVDRLSERRPRAVALTACARLILVAVWHTWTSGKAFEDSNPERHARKLRHLDAGSPRRKGRRRKDSG